MCPHWITGRAGEQVSLGEEGKVHPVMKTDSWRLSFCFSCSRSRSRAGLCWFLLTSPFFCMTIVVLITLNTQKLGRFVLFPSFAISADLLHYVSPSERRILTTKTSALKRQVFRTQSKRDAGLGSAEGSDLPSSCCLGRSLSESGEKGRSGRHSRNFRSVFQS